MPAFYKDLDLGIGDLVRLHVLIVQDAVSHTSGWQTLHCFVEGRVQPRRQESDGWC